MLAADVQSHLSAKLDALLTHCETREFAVAFSGGGDSTAILHALRDHPNCRAVFIVDHGLRPESRDEALRAKNIAARFGLKADILTWENSGASTGLQEKARRARYALMGQACRAQKIGALVTGHTRDDQVETLLMRYDRGTDWRGAAGMAEYVYAPLWPELAEVTLLRPALEVSRAALRAYNTEHGLDWSEDPSNQNTDFARIRARKYLIDKASLADDLLATASELRGGRESEQKHLVAIADDIITIDEVGHIAVSRPLPARLLSLCLQAASGNGDPIRTEPLRKLTKRMTSPRFAGATLAGARVCSSSDGFLIIRDPGSVLGRGDQRGLSPMTVTINPTLWDGRFWVSAQAQNVHVVPLGTALKKSGMRLSSEQKDKLRHIPPKARATLPAVIIENDIIAAGTQALHRYIRCVPAVADHFYGKLGRPSS